MYNQLKFTISLLFVFILNTSQCQFNSIFGDSYTEWNYMTMYCDALFVETYQQSDDTIIGTTQYKIIDDFGLLRESEDKSKVWYRAFGSEQEQIIMDLELEVGDMFEIHSTEFEVEEVYIEDGRKVIQFDFLPPNCGIVEPMRFVEGLGPNLGFKYMLSVDEFDVLVLRCYTRDSITTNFYEDQLGDDCFEGGVSTEELVESKISIYPNPFGERVHIVFEETSERTIKIFDFLGRNIYSKISNAIEIDINTALYRKGIYMLQIQEGARVRTSIVVKE